MKKYVSHALVAASLIVLNACGGSGSGSPTLPNPGVGQQGQKGNVAFTILIPAKSTAVQARSAKYLTSSVAGVQISAIAAVPAVPTPTPGPSASPMPPPPSGGNFYPVTSSQSYCSSSTAGLTCTLALQAPAGNDLFTITTYDAPNYTGNVISTGTLTAQINAGATNTINVVTHGVPQWGIVGIGNPAPAAGAASTTNVAVNMVDADGSVIVGTFDSPVNIVALDSTSVFVPSISFSKASFSQNSDTTGLTMSYTGAAIPNGGTATVYLESTSPMLGGTGVLTPSSPRISEGNMFTPGSLAAVPSLASLYFAHANSAAQTVSLTSANGAAAPTLTLGTCSGLATISGSGAGPYTVTPVAKTDVYGYYAYGSGNCDLTAMVGTSGSTNIPVLISP